MLNSICWKPCQPRLATLLQQQPWTGTSGQCSRSGQFTVSLTQQRWCSVTLSCPDRLPEWQNTLQEGCSEPARPAWMSCRSSQPHWSVGRGGLFKDGFTFSLTCKRVGMCQACLQLAAAIFGMRNDLWHSSASYILFLHSWSVSRLNSDCVMISQNKNQSPSLSPSLVPILQRWCCFFTIHIYSQADKNVKFLCSVFSSCSGNWVEYCSVW